MAAAGIRRTGHELACVFADTRRDGVGVSIPNDSHQERLCGRQTLVVACGREQVVDMLGYPVPQHCNLIWQWPDKEFAFYIPKACGTR